MPQNPQSDPQYSTLNQHINKYIRPNNTKAWIALAISFMFETIAIGMIYMNVLPLLGWTIHSMNLIRCFVQFHDMAHFSFFETPELNKAVGHAFGVLVQFPFQMWRDGHNFHHRHFGNLDRIDLSQTILFTQKQYDSWSTPKKIVVRFFREPVIFFFLSAQIVWNFGVTVSIIKRYGVFSLPLFEKIISLFFFYILYALGLPWFEHFLCIYLTTMIGTALFHLQHSVNTPYRSHNQSWNFTKAALEGSTYLQIPYFLRPFTNGIEYHHIHHLNTNVASYTMQECHDKLDQEKQLNWNYFNINRVGWWLSAKSMFNVMLNEQSGRMVPFSYKKL